MLLYNSDGLYKKLLNMPLSMFIKVGLVLVPHPFEAKETKVQFAGGRLFPGVAASSPKNLNL